MEDDALQAALAKLEQDGAAPEVRAAFARRFAQLDDPQAGYLHGDDLTPLADDDVPRLEDLDAGEADAILERVVVIKLNGGLGTSMGLTGPKSLIDVKPGRTFLDVIQHQAAAAGLPLVLMSSFSTDAATRDALGEDTRVRTFLQSREPKLDAETRRPVEYPKNPALEWCPPGHGDVYVSLAASGTLDALLAEGRDWAFISNSDNLGATVDPRIPAHAAAHAIPFVMETVRGTPADRKGGHVARRKDDGRLVLRETAQAPPGDDSFTDFARWRFYNTNNLWVDLTHLKRLLQEDPAGPHLPLIVNRKTVDPRDPSSPQVLQLETAMGAALGAIDGARAVLVPRTRFAPVKTTEDLLVVRSDAYTIDDAGHVAQTTDEPPVVTLDPKYYRSLPDMERRFPHGAPSLNRATALTVEGDVTFGADVQVIGDVTVRDGDAVADGAILRG
jgi:UTP--glucose-1-phosphate uridylyltransferase